MSHHTNTLLFRTRSCTVLLLSSTISMIKKGWLFPYDSAVSTTVLLSLFYYSEPRPLQYSLSDKFDYFRTTQTALRVRSISVRSRPDMRWGLYLRMHVLCVFSSYWRKSWINMSPKSIAGAFFFANLNKYAQHTRTLTPYEHTYSTHMNTSKRLCRHISRLMKSPQVAHCQRKRRLPLRSTTPLNPRINPEKYKHLYHE